MNFHENTQGVRKKQEKEASGILVVGYGNAENQDDGIGPFVVGRLEEVLHVADSFRFLTRRRLTPDIAVELRYADAVFFVAATGGPLAGGWRCRKIEAETDGFYIKTNTLKPEALLGLVWSLYRRKLPAWVISVQGECFASGSGITAAARKTIDRSFSMIVEAVLDIHAKIE